jgi:hypothetical protein
MRPGHRTNIILPVLQNHTSVYFCQWPIVEYPSKWEPYCESLPFSKLVVYGQLTELESTRADRPRFWCEYHLLFLVLCLTLLRRLTKTQTNGIKAKGIGSGMRIGGHLCKSSKNLEKKAKTSSYQLNLHPSFGEFTGPAAILLCDVHRFLMNIIIP